MDVISILFKSKEFDFNLMKNNTLLIGVVIVLLLSNLFFGYMFFFHNNRTNFNRGEFPQMQLTDEQIQSVTSFFEDNFDTNEITDYCNNNRMECFYYCRTINPDHEICSQLMQGRPNSQQTQRLN
ncbi:MAG TPA: hypothetical protein VJ438_02625 [Candidatus Nanoarchaeia archaeon]|nr:hypothetical protein [Candidatus Nanoarchaeia archaeon]